MKPVLVRLEPLTIGTVIVSDVADSRGRLLVKAPVPLDEALKDLLRQHGVREVFIEDRRKGGEESEKVLQSEREMLLRRLAFLGDGHAEKALKALLLETIEKFYTELTK
jgi:Lhr-like helicase